jgi:hypothetical protein
MASQWDPGNFKPLDVNKILGYPRQMPPRYEKWLPRFTSNDGVIAEDHMDNLWAFFQLHPISDDVEDLAMKLLSSTLHGNARKWYDGLLDDNITFMDQLEETFIKIWNIKIEYIHMLIKIIEHMKQTHNDLSGNSLPGLRICYTKFLESITLKTSTSLTSIPMHSQCI